MRMELAIKDLSIRWRQMAEQWSDPVSRAFESNYLDALEDRVRLAGGALDKMRETIARARRDCEDR